MPAVYNVTGFADGAGSVTPVSPGVFSATTLRAAMTAADADSADDVINLQPTTGPASTYLLTQGELTANKSSGTLTVQCSGGQATIDAGGASRVFLIGSAGASSPLVTLDNLEITGGYVDPHVDPTYPNGGGIFDLGNLTLQNCVVTQNHVVGGPSDIWVRGGGICTGVGSTLTMIGCTVSSNTATGYADPSFGAYDGVGGGLMIDAGNATVTNCVFDGNAAVGGTGPSVGGNGRGGAICIFGSMSGQPASTTTITGCTFENNQALGGTATGSGGVSGFGQGGAVYDGLAAGSTDPGAVVAITNSTFYANAALSPALSNNNHGGAICVDLGPATLTNDTIVQNQVADSGGGGGLYASDSTLVANTIIAENVNTLNNPTADDVNGILGSSGHNLIGAAPPGSVFHATGDMAGTSANPISPGLGPLQNNGGPTPTMALLPGSAALDEGDPSLAPATDQRGFPRVANGGLVDIGAWENQFQLFQVTPPGSVPSPQSGVSTSFDLGSFSETSAPAGPWSVDVTWSDLTADTQFFVTSQGALGSQSHMFTAPGSYPVTVTVTDTDGNFHGVSFLVNVPKPSPLGSSPHATYVTNLYQLLLNREPDAAAQAWVNLLDGGAAPTAIVLGLEQSAEYEADTVNALYQRYLGRSADSSGLAAWVAFLQGGGTVEQTALGIVLSPEFQARHGDDTGFVTVLYQDILNRTPDSAGLASWVSALGTGVSRAAVAGSFLGSAEYRANLIGSYYHQYLKRSPDAAGLASWLSALQAGVADSAVLAGILGSTEGFADWS